MAINAATFIGTDSLVQQVSRMHAAKRDQEVRAEDLEASLQVSRETRAAARATGEEQAQQAKKVTAASKDEKERETKAAAAAERAALAMSLKAAAAATKEMQRQESKPRPVTNAEGHKTGRVINVVA